MKALQIQFVSNGHIVRKTLPSASTTLLDMLREDMAVKSVKEGCGEGDCGACTVVLASLENGKPEYRAINACIRLASSIDGMAIWTAEDIRVQKAAGEASLHPVQQAMLEAHASQCGFCTPGFVMSLYALYQNKIVRDKAKTLSRQEVEQALSGNLCRCTGYRAILDAAQSLPNYPVVSNDEAALTAQLQSIAKTKSLTEILQAKAERPDALWVAGTTDVGLWITKRHQRFDDILDLSQVAELKNITQDDMAIHIGAAVSVQDAFQALVKSRPQLASFAHRFAGLPVRNSGTLGGNIANGSPIGDSMPLLISLGASITLAKWDSNQNAIATRSLPLEKLYTDYRQNVMEKTELVQSIRVPLPTKNEFSRVYKVSKRFEDDISAVCLAICLQLEDGIVKKASIGVGGVAAVPARAVLTEAEIKGKAWDRWTMQDATSSMDRDFDPISDMRASARCQIEILWLLWFRFWQESQGEETPRLDNVEAWEGVV